MMNITVHILPIGLSDIYTGYPGTTLVGRKQKRLQTSFILFPTSMYINDEHYSAYTSDRAIGYLHGISRDHIGLSDIYTGYPGTTLVGRKQKRLQTSFILFPTSMYINDEHYSAYTSDRAIGYLHGISRDHIGRPQTEKITNVLFTFSFSHKSKFFCSGVNKL
ncbi:hypothetical protein J6590_039364 [Homalodisca vitripennis]|nr:hypothetical protein J6590_039364 [Homalodisca vitripennis]